MRDTIGEITRPGTDLDAGLGDALSAVEVGVSLPTAIGLLPLRDRGCSPLHRAGAQQASGAVRVRPRWRPGGQRAAAPVVGAGPRPPGSATAGCLVIA